MKRLTILIALIFAGLYLNASDNNCTQSTESWKSEKEAIASIESTTFSYSESFHAEKSEWMESVQYYSCDEEYGYMVVKCNKKTYFHQEVPMAVWKALKEANSPGGYYNFYIKNKYKFDKKDSNTPFL
jgi:hypothetical protein